jgi:hypothetical protein
MRTASQCGAQGAACSPCGGCQHLLGDGPVPDRFRVALEDHRRLREAGQRRLGSKRRRRRRRLPDPFCEYENPAGQVTTTTAGVTDTLTDTRNPTWNQIITPPG